MRNITTEDDYYYMCDAARDFADRIARREYGRRGYARTCTQDSWGTVSATYQAFIGVDDKDGCTEGEDIWFTVSIV